jgi:putative ABC transport system permease protein
VALLVMIFRKMVKNKWLELSLLMGLVLIVAMVSSMPIYTDAILQRMLVKELEQKQITSNVYSGGYTAAVTFSDVVRGNVTPTERIARLDRAMNQAKDTGFQLPTHEFVIERYTPMFKLIPTDTTKINPDIKRFANIVGMSGLEDNIRLVDGRLPAKEQPVNGVYEALIVANAQIKLTMVLNDELEFEDSKLLKQNIRIKAVGVIDKKDYDSLYWSNKNINFYQQSFIIPFDTFERDITKGVMAPLRTSSWYFALDYSKIKVDNIADYMDTDNFIKKNLNANVSTNISRAEALPTLKGYDEREQKLRLLLWSMNVPVLIMLAFYLYMVANLITDRQKTEIAVLRSRGASRFQIMTSFFIEGVILSIVAIAIGPFLGLVLTRALGASNGFLEFVQRSAMEVTLVKDAYIYGLYALAIGLLMIMVPALIATKATIVGHKQQLARKTKLSFLHRYYLDIILVAISLYGLNSFNQRIKDLAAAGLDSAQFSIDPLLFLVPALFILGCGLLSLRIYPYLIRFIYWIGRKWWSPSLYSTLIQVGRSSTQYQFLMVFLVMTLATGFFSASAARTMNQNNHDKILYQNGADIVLKTFWQNDAPPPAPPGGPPVGATLSPKRVQYTEPLYDSALNKLPGVEHYAKVFIKEDAYFSTSNAVVDTKLYGIDTDDFGMTAWFKNSILDHHINDYLNLIATEPSAVLISRSIATEQGLKPGDPISLGWDMVEPRNFIVYGIIDYFPTFQPNPTAPAEPLPHMIVGHLSTIKTLLAVEPYEYWFNLKPDASRVDFVKAIEEQKIFVTEYRDTVQEINDMKSDPFQLAVNGVMTLGFIISIIISFCGFLLYWILTLQGRILQIGIFRAMGISFRQLIYMLVAEQMLTSGAAILIGSLDGNLTSRLFVPFFQLSFDPTTQVPPFEVIFDPKDTMSLFIIVTLMIATGLAILAYLLSRIKIHQAVKLGED